MIADDNSVERSYELFPTFHNQYSDNREYKAIVQFDPYSFLIFNGSKHIIPDEWTYSMYFDDWKTPKIKIDKWDFVDIPIGIPQKSLMP